MIRRFVSRAGVAVYGICRASGVLNTWLGSSLFSVAYGMYKRLVEDGLAAMLRNHRHLVAGGFVFDIGANIGYTASLLARYCDPPFEVLAFEPEPENVVLLRRSIRRGKSTERIVIHEVAVGRATGVALLWRNKNHHGDHRIATQKFRGDRKETLLQVPMMSIDDAWARFTDRGPVSFIKIDVQGFEPEVLAGMTALLASQRRLTIVLEYDPLLSESLGLSAALAPALLAEAGFELFRLERGGVLVPLTPADLDARGDYFDIVAMRS